MIDRFKAETKLEDVVTMYETIMFHDRGFQVITRRGDEELFERQLEIALVYIDDMKDAIDELAKVLQDMT